MDFDKNLPEPNLIASARGLFPRARDLAQNSEIAGVVVIKRGDTVDHGSPVCPRRYRGQGWTSSERVLAVWSGAVSSGPGFDPESAVASRHRALTVKHRIRGYFQFVSLAHGRIVLGGGTFEAGFDDATTRITQIFDQELPNLPVEEFGKDPCAFIVGGLADLGLL